MQRVTSSNHGLRLVRQRDNTLVLNGINDAFTYSQNQRNLVTRPNEVLYQRSSPYDKSIKMPVQVPNEYSKDATQPYEREPVFVNRETGRLGLKGLKKPGSSRSDTRLPVVATFNGVKADTIGEAMRHLAFVGVAELTGRDTNTPGLSISAGGVKTTTNQTPQPIALADYVLAHPAPVDLVASGSLKPGDGMFSPPSSPCIFSFPPCRKCRQCGGSCARCLYRLQSGIVQFLECAPCAPHVWSKYRGPGGRQGGDAPRGAGQVCPTRQ